MKFLTQQAFSEKYLTKILEGKQSKNKTESVAYTAYKLGWMERDIEAKAAEQKAISDKLNEELLNLENDN